MSRRYDRDPFRSRRTGSSLTDGFYLVVLIAAVVALLVLTPLLRVLPPLLLMALLVIAVHEGGHVFAGTRVDFTFPFVKIGPFQIAWRRRPWQIRYVGGWWDGAAYAEPLHTFDMRRREAILVAGGPLASYALVLVAWGLWLLLDPGYPGAPGSTWKDTLGHAVQLIGVCSGATGTINLIPFRYGGFRSDGLRLFGLLRETLQAKRRW